MAALQIGAGMNPDRQPPISVYTAATSSCVRPKHGAKSSRADHESPLEAIATVRVQPERVRVAGGRRPEVQAGHDRVPNISTDDDLIGDVVECENARPKRELCPTTKVVGVSTRVGKSRVQPETQAKEGAEDDRPHVEVVAGFNAERVDAVGGAPKERDRVSEVVDERRAEVKVHRKRIASAQPDSESIGVHH